MKPEKIRVLVVDDSSVVRHAICEALRGDAQIDVVGTAADPYQARDKILALQPDVLTLDIEMPRMDGITFLRILQQHRPLPVVVVSSLTQAGSRAALDALEAGAVDVMAKPSSALSIGELGPQLRERVKGAAAATLSPRPVAANGRHCALSKSARFDPRQVILLGASTGGTEAIKHILRRLPDGLPPICIVQHIPPVFSKAFAMRLNELCAFEVREAVSGDELRPGLALVAPGDYHTMILRDGNRYRVALNQGPPVNYTRPAVDVLFSSAAVCAGRQVTAALLTGMGADGARGLKKLRAAGAATFAQDEATCVVYGMPRAAAELGAAETVLPLEKIPEALLASVLSRSAVPGESKPPQSVLS
ncbi:MAG TPA: chemotaxis response regulator protein-glutamate methylesterase [Verrucomicrobiae bacterium]|nr:chemotaxis response regulator protein-glutamate methylesterase [Verrucomicrobiae bacterium]